MRHDPEARLDGRRSSTMRRTMSRSLALLLVSAIGTQAAFADRLLFESYVGNRPAEANRIAPLIRSVFERRGFTVDPQVLTMLFREHAYRPGLVAPKFADTLKRASLAAEDDFSEEKYAKVAEDLGKLILSMRQNLLIFTREPKYRDLALRVLVYYALACDRQAQVLTLAGKPDEAAKAERLRDDTMTEVIRSFPSKTITSKGFGQDAEILFLQIREQLNKAGRGRLLISTSDPDAVIYLDEIVQGTAKVDIADLVPGIYRVLIQMPTGEARQYEAEVTAKQVARLTVDWGVDSLLVLVLEGWAGFKYPTEKEHAREAQLVHLLAQTHTNASVAATVTVVHAHGQLAVIGTSYDTRSGKLLASGRVELTGSPSNDTMLNHLVDCLMGEQVEGVMPVRHPEYTPPPPEVEVSRPPPAPAPTTTSTVRTTVPDISRPAEAEHPRELPKWLAAGGAVGALALGSYALYKDNTCDGVSDENGICKYRYTRAAPIGYASVGTGLVLGALATYLFLRTTRKAPKVTVAPSHTGALIRWDGEF
jgi:hypothetical protein